MRILAVTTKLFKFALFSDGGAGPDTIPDENMEK